MRLRLLMRLVKAKRKFEAVKPPLSPLKSSELQRCLLKRQNRHLQIAQLATRLFLRPKKNWREDTNGTKSVSNAVSKFNFREMIEIEMIVN